MNWSADVLLFVLYAGLGVVTFTVFIVLRKRSSASQWYISALLVAFALGALAYAAQPLGWAKLLAWLFPVAVISPFAIAPLMNSYIRAHYEKPGTHGLDYRGFIPLLLALSTFTLPVYVLQWTADTGDVSLPLWLLSVPILGVVYLIVSLFKAFRMLANYRRSLQHEFSNLNQKELRWITHWVSGITLVILLDLIIAGVIVNRPDWQWLTGLNAMVFIGLMVFLSYHAVIQPPNLWQGRYARHLSPKARADGDKWDQAAIDLDELMRTDKPYLDPNLNRGDLATQAGLTDKQLSQILNQTKKQNFFQYVNSYRVGEFQEKIRLNAHQHKTLLGVAFESGFNSKASFNRIFKETTGQTPRHFLSQERNKSQ
ncbi:MAG: helix-turn-helix domain-containing protein [Bacteroidota bacterium]